MGFKKRETRAVSSSGLSEVSAKDGVLNAMANKQYIKRNFI
jgi:hypothetical protein